MIEYGRPDLASRAAALYDAMDFLSALRQVPPPFPHRTRSVFGHSREGWYDLMASEARLSGYIAVARGDAPRRHWRQLSRAMVQKDGFRGMASWTGTMFEYLMPELFLPLCRESLLWESAKFCLYVQRRRVRGASPWGISERALSCPLTRLSPTGTRLTAVPALALKRGMDEELVVSPYSTFLALVIEPDNALKNLRKLEKLGALGPFGFWEAWTSHPPAAASIPASWSGASWRTTSV
jgi:cyclic beta-1,2-glucan synthetase